MISTKERKLPPDFEACFATCQCYDANDNPTHMHDAICILDECFCVFDACPYGRLASSPICCTKVITMNMIYAITAFSLFVLVDFVFHLIAMSDLVTKPKPLKK